ncbi:PAS domain S-box protein [Massilia sp. YIM B02763]|uniref:PAS domain S-box protein n=1 Tax=Massilia sp. YIM B02763 TaxID=3050130 RepID=UPI0025B6D86C|nr:PAS domain S-box protein [Massilia sp. YIM B02763]MDN4055042.1 PAS domain S-box protein [Massilia sp. YIM B02763]
MQIAARPPSESARQASLDALQLLDTAPEPVFDRITRLTARLLDVPVALFSLVDRERQWFKSRVGLDAVETPREQAFCAHTILGSEPLVVEDAARDARFADNPLVTGGPHIRFYAGAPVRTSQGHAVGTLCAIDSKPRVLSAEDRQTLQDLADIMSKEVQARERLDVARERVLESSAAARASEDRFRLIFELASVGIALVAPNGAWMGVNAALCAILGYTERELMGLTFQDITWHEDLDADLQLLARLQRGEIASYQMEKRYVRKNGDPVWASLNVSSKTAPDGAIEYYVAAIGDIGARKAAEEAIRRMNAELEQRIAARTHELQNTNAMLTASVIQQRRAEGALREREAELRSVIQNASDAYICLDERGVVVAWNRQAELTFGWSASEALDQPLTDLIVPPAYVDAYREDMQRYLRTGASAMIGRRVELPGRRKDGSIVTLEVRVTALEVNGRRIFSGFLHDISDRKLAEARRDFEARNDALTGLPNRRALMEQLPVAQKRAQRAGHALALLFIDLDGFKAVNDSRGHEAGDRLLEHVARSLRGAVRETDGVYRLAGDEFTVVLENVQQARDAVAIAEKLIRAVSQPVRVCGSQVQVGASIGIAMYAPGSALDADALIKEADHWMYQAKLAGRGQVRWRGVA